MDNQTSNSGTSTAARRPFTGIGRLAVATALALLCAAEAWGQSIAPVNPEYIRWQKRKQTKPQDLAQTNTLAKAMRRTTATVAEAEHELGLAPDIFDTSYLGNLNQGIQRGIKDALDSRYDLREKNMLTPVRDQGDYGTCWAHATCSSLESGMLREGKGVFDFSENNMVNLHGFDWGFDDGGNGSLSSAYLLRWGGPVLESSDPYPNPGQSAALTPVRHIQNIRWIAGRTSYTDNDDIKAAIVANGALHVNYYHVFSSSCYNSGRAAYYFNGNKSRKTNHAVAVVGWDDDYPASNFATTPPGNGAFIVRNNWGVDWGDGGYFYVSYYDESFAWGTLYAFSNTEDSDNYDNLYYYDPLGMIGSIGYKAPTAWGASIFTAAETTQLAAVGFYALVPNTSYAISIYTGCSAGNPTSGTLATSQNGKTDFAGFVTVPFNSKVPLAARQRFSVVIQLATPGYTYPLAYEYAYLGYSSAATAVVGQSFLSYNGSSWSDFTEVNGSASFCCKAYTKSAIAVTPTLTAIAITDGASSITSGENALFKCEATYSDGSQKNVSPSWSISEGSAYATIAASGLLTAKSVTSQQRVTVKASYTEDGIEKMDTWGLFVTVAPPERPTDVSASQGTEPSCVRVTWTAPNGATEYAVYRGRTDSAQNAQYIDQVTVAKYNDTKATPGIDYWYFVKAKNSSGASDFSTGAMGWRALTAPSDVSASNGSSEESVTITWSAANGATAYKVWRADDFDAEPQPLTGWITATEWPDATAVPGVIYWYSVSAAVDASGSRPSERSVPDDGYRAVPVVPSSLSIIGDDAIPSGGTAPYTAYVLYSDGHQGDSPVSPTWTVSAGSVSLAGEVTAPVVSANTEIILVANTTVDGIHVSGTNRITVTAVTLPAPANVVATAPSPSTGITVSWNAVPGASGYTLTRTAMEGASAGSTATFQSSASPYADTTTTPGVLYSYRVAAVNAAGVGAQSATVTARVPLAAPTGVKATCDRTDCVRVTWNAVTGASHYRVTRATSQNGTKTELGSWTSSLSIDDVPPADNTSYWYFVKAATDATGANSGDYSVGAQGMKKPVRTLVSLSISGPDRVPASGEAVYSCSATYSDGTMPKVTPLWSASAGAIGVDGKFSAPAVSSDTTATIASSFGGLSTNLAVTIVAPVVERTAEITSVTAAQRWPFSGLIDIDYTLATTPAGTRAAVSVSAIDEDHGVAIPATTLSGDGASGPVEAGTHRITWNLAADHPGFHAASLAVSLSAVPAVTIGVTFDAGGGTASQTTVSYNAGSAYGSLPTASRTGYNFVGWFTAATGGTQVTETTIADENVTTLYAHWTNERGKVQLWEGGPYWATTNIGADEPHEYGLYFWWGDTIGYRREGDAWIASDRSSSNFSFAIETTPTYDKSPTTLLSDGWIVSKGTTYILAPEHDAAHVQWGGNWRMPTDQELDALNCNCDWTLTTLNGVNGYVVSGRGVYASNSIFLPCAGRGNGTSLASSNGSGGCYWSSVPSSDSYYSRRLYFFYSFYSNTGSHYVDYTDSRFYGQSVRPVQGAAIGVTFDAGGGIASQTSISYSAGSAYGSLPTASRTGYNFVGWFTAATGGTQVTETTVADENVTTLYAHWMAKERGKVQLWENGPYWATTNIGADEPHEYGLYFWWGDTVGYRREGNTWVASDGSSSLFSFESGNTPTYGKTSATLQSEGWIVSQNGTYALAPEHDAAHVQWGGGWRMPTQLELTALNNNCDWIWTTQNGVNGYIIRGRGGFVNASIFLPCAGTGYGTSLIDAGSFGCYWSSVPYANDISWNLYFYSSYHDANYFYFQNYGLSIRPVQGAAIGVTFDAGGGIASQTSISYSAGSAYGSLPTASRTGYNFVGWFTAATGGTQVTETTVADENVTTLYAHWTAKERGKVQLWEGGPYWATTNIGADEPHEYGLYFWWGDTVGYRREGNTWVASDGSSSPFSFESGNTPTYGKNSATLQSEGWIVLQDGTYALAPEHDAAHVQWGGGWRMPTYQELNDLCYNKCDWTWTMQNGINGYVVRGRGNYAGACIFLPGTGDGNGTSLRGAGSSGGYWTSTLYSSNNAYALGFYSGGHDWFVYDYYLGFPIRPVQGFTE